MATTQESQKMATKLSSAHAGSQTVALVEIETRSTNRRPTDTDTGQQDLAYVQVQAQMRVCI